MTGRLFALMGFRVRLGTPLVPGVALFCLGLFLAPATVAAAPAGAARPTGGTAGSPPAGPTAGTASAQPSTPELDKSSPSYQKARALFKLGIQDFDGGYYTRAIQRFKAAFKLFPSPKIHTRIALCYKWLSDYLKALEHYEIFLRLMPKHPPKPADALLRERVQTKEIPKLLAMVIQVRLEVDTPAGAEVRVNGRKVGVSPLMRTVRLNPGPVAISATRKGYYGFKRDLSIARGKSATVRFRLLKIKPKVIKKVIKVPATPIYKRWWFWTTIGAVVAGGAAGLGAWLSLQEHPRDVTGTTLRHDGLTLRW